MLSQLKLHEDAKVCTTRISTSPTAHARCIPAPADSLVPCNIKDKSHRWCSIDPSGGKKKIVDRGPQLKDKYQSMITDMDAALGKVLRALKEVLRAKVVRHMRVVAPSRAVAMERVAPCHAGYARAACTHSGARSAYRSSIYSTRRRRVAPRRPL